MQKIKFLIFGIPLILLGTTIPFSQFRAPANLSTVTLLTKSVDQSGLNKFCNSTRGTTAFTCSFNGTQRLTSYSKGMILTLFVDTSCNGGCTVNIDALGPIAIKDSLTGMNDIQVLADQPHLIFYDGIVFRLML